MNSMSQKISDHYIGIDEVLKNKRVEILRIATQHGARNIRVFGPVARGEARSGSDVDFLVDVEAGRSVLDLDGLLMVWLRAERGSGPGVAPPQP
jgi:predicted nucleotidyltransferase